RTCNSIVLASPTVHTWTSIALTSLSLHDALPIFSVAVMGLTQSALQLTVLRGLQGASSGTVAAATVPELAPWMPRRTVNCKADCVSPITATEKIGRASWREREVSAMLVQVCTVGDASTMELHVR